MTIDPKTFGGIEIDSIARYLENPKRYDVAVKRLDTVWFQSDSETDGLGYRRRVCDVALRETGNKHGSILMWRLIRKMLRRATLAYRFVRQKIRTGKREIPLSRITKSLGAGVYTCSGFVQWCYYQGVAQVLYEGGLDKPRLREVVFNPRSTRNVTECTLLSTTPADLARSARLSWKYVIKGGVVWEVSSEREVNSVINSGKESGDGNSRDLSRCFTEFK